MTQIEKIKAEIERRINSYLGLLSKPEMLDLQEEINAKIETLRCILSHINSLQAEQNPVWLEKQRPINPTMIEKERIDNAFTKMMLKEQKPESITDEWIEDYWRHEKVNNPYSYDKGDEIQFDHQGFVRFCKKYCKNPVEWSEEDNKKIKFLVNLVNEWCDKAPIATSMVKEEMSDWLKSLKQRIGGKL